jgi:hypothetical protein
MGATLRYDRSVARESVARETGCLAGPARLAQRGLRTDVACARALLDALEAVLDAESDEGTQRDVIVQMAGQLTRVASRMEAWKAVRAQDEPSEPCGGALGIFPRRP